MLMVLAKPTTPQLQLAILAARLTTKIADNDALIRCNNELAETNLRLQNEVDDLRAQLQKKADAMQGIIHGDSESHKLEDREDQDGSEERTTDDWNWGADNINRNDSVGQEAEMAALRKAKEGLELQVERLEKRLEASEDYSYELERKLEEAQAYAAVVRQHESRTATVDKETQDNFPIHAIIDEFEHADELKKLMDEQKNEMKNAFAQIETISRLYEDEQTARRRYQEELERVRGELSECRSFKSAITALTKSKEDLETKVADLEDQLESTLVEQKIEKTTVSAEVQTVEVGTNHLTVEDGESGSDGIVKMLIVENNALKEDLQMLWKKHEELKAEQQNYCKELEKRNEILEKDLTQAKSDLETLHSVGRLRTMEVLTEELGDTWNAPQDSSEQSWEDSETLKVIDEFIPDEYNKQQIKDDVIEVKMQEPGDLKYTDTKKERKLSQDTLEQAPVNVEECSGKVLQKSVSTQTADLNDDWDVWGDREEEIHNFKNATAEIISLKNQLVALQDSLDNNQKNFKDMQDHYAEMEERNTVLEKKLAEEKLNYQRTLLSLEERAEPVVQKARADSSEASAQTSEPDDFWDAASDLDEHHSEKGAEIRNLVNEKLSLMQELLTVKNVLDGIKQKLYMTEEYSTELEERNMELEKKLTAASTRDELLNRSERVDVFPDEPTKERLEDSSQTDTNELDISNVLRERLATENEEINSLKQEICSVKEELQSANKSIAEAREEYVEKQQKLQQMAERIREQARCLATVIVSQRDEFERERRDVGEELATLQEHLLLLENELAAWELECSKLRNDYNIQLLEITKLRETEEESTFERENLNRKLEDLHLQLDAAKENESDRERSVQELSQKNELLQDSECRLMETVDRYANECERLEKEKQMLEKELRIIEKDRLATKGVEKHTSEVGVQHSLKSKEMTHAATGTDETR